MPKTLSDSNMHFSFRKAVQISDSHCGPAVLQMLLSNVGVDISQEQITEAAGAVQTITKYGIWIDHMVKAVQKLAPMTTFWYKDHSQLNDIRILLNTYSYPVGVEWQGLFEGQARGDNADEYGHYSVITHIDDVRNALVIVDPYKDYALQDRIISTQQFVKRWWDTNEVKNPKTKRRRTVRDDQMLFIVTPKEAAFPHLLQMKNEF